jgi:hypothetical protein
MSRLFEIANRRRLSNSPKYLAAPLAWKKPPDAKKVGVRRGILPGYPRRRQGTDWHRPLPIRTSNSYSAVSNCGLLCGLGPCPARKEFFVTTDLAGQAHVSEPLIGHVVLALSPAQLLRHRLNLRSTVHLVDKIVQREHLFSLRLQLLGIAFEGELVAILVGLLSSAFDLSSLWNVAATEIMPRVWGLEVATCEVAPLVQFLTVGVGTPSRSKFVWRVNSVASPRTESSSRVSYATPWRS